jgi:hypothetical protein
MKQKLLAKKIYLPTQGNLAISEYAWCRRRSVSMAKTFAVKS